MEIHVPNRQGIFENVVLRHQDLTQYLDNPSCLGATVGPLAGRVCLGQLIKGKKKIQLSKNHGNHHIHGGQAGLQHQFFKLERIEEADVVTLVYHLDLAHGLEGYPGNRVFRVTYQVYDDFKIKISYEARSDQDTWINLTHHGYFNLSGDFNEGVEKHVLKLNADKILPLSEDFLPLGYKESVLERPFDFRYARNLSSGFMMWDKQLILAKGYDHPFCFSEGAKIRLYEPLSGRWLRATCESAEFMVLYTMNWPVPPYGIRKGVCFEFQNPPIGLEGCFMEASYIPAEKVYQHEILFEFGCEP